MTPLLLALLAAPPKPPAPLEPWVDYAKRLVDTGPACPPGRECVQVERVELGGSVAEGRVSLTARGENLGRVSQTVALLQPAATFSITGARWRRGGGHVRLAADAWMLDTRPGAFEVELDVRFTPSESVPMQLGVNVAQIVDRLAQGTLAFDESSDRHGGVMFLLSGKRASEAQQAVTVRAVRELKYGSVVTFTYRFTVSGLREQARVELPRLGGETIEALSPDIAYTVSERALTVTLTPGTSSIAVSGHFAEAPATLAKPATLPFEYWAIDVDPRHPVQLATTGVEIDPGEVPGVAPGPRSRAFFLTEAQALTIAPLAVSLDKGRLGAGTASILYTQGKDDQWIGALSLTSTTAPESDRITIPTPAAPHYAESAGEAVRMFADGGVLSLRVLNPDGALQPISVQWRESLSTNAILAAPSFAVPGQSLHLDDATVVANFLPGHVPVAVFGAEHATGHLIDGLHIYAVLIALLGVALARGARFPPWGVAITAILLVGLYTVDGFPRTALLILLAGCAALARLPANALTAARGHRFVHALVSLVWIGILTFTLVPAALYMKDRVYSALHPWASAQPQEQVRFANLPQQSNALVGDILEDESSGGSYLKRGKAEEVQQVKKKPVPKATEKTIRPVAFDASALPATAVHFAFGALLPGDGASARVLVAGPFLRALWMFVETAAFGAVLALLVLRARLWWRAAR